MLLLDGGNTAIKCQLGEDVTVFLLDAPSFQPAFKHYISTINANTHVVLSSVTRPDIFKTITSLLTSHFKQPPKIAVTEEHFGRLNIGYKITEQLGVDRWLALIATQHLAAPRIVIDAGSWIKMDVVLEQGEHQGGVIISKTAELEANIFKRFGINSEQCHALNIRYGTSTHQCLCLAKGHYSFEAISVFLKQWLPHLKSPCHIIVSGGDAPLVMAALKNLNPSLQKYILDIQHIENLVLSGLSIRYSG